MPNAALRGCGKAVQSLRTATGKTLGQSSTAFHGSHPPSLITRVKARLTPRLIRTFPQYSSPATILFSPLIEHYLYPVSTGPTITNTEEKFKER